MTQSIDNAKKQLISNITRRLQSLDEVELQQVEGLLNQFSIPEIETKCDWPHAPMHRLGGKGTFLVTAGTYLKDHHFRDSDSLNFLQKSLLKFSSSKNGR